MKRLYRFDPPAGMPKDDGSHFMNTVGYIVFFLFVVAIVVAILGIQYIKRSDKPSDVTLKIDTTTFRKRNPDAIPTDPDYYDIEYPVTLTWGKSRLEDRYMVYIGTATPLTITNSQISVETDPRQEVYPAPSGDPSNPSIAWIAVDSRVDTPVYAAVSVYYKFLGMFGIEGVAVPATSVTVPANPNAVPKPSN